VRRISNSEATSWLTCRARYRYEFDMNLQKIGSSDALDKGNLIHAILEEYYKARMLGDSHEEAVVMGRKALIPAMDTYGMELIAKVDPLMQAYFNHYQHDNWEILSVEDSFDLPITDDFTMPTRLDLLVKTSDGKIWIVDHKSTYDFWTTDDIELNAQLPKYVATLRNMGYDVAGAIINQIRTRSVKNNDAADLFRRVKIVPSIAIIRSVLSQQMAASKEITTYREQPEDIRKAIATPVLNKIVCKYCSFRGLCASEIAGGEIEYLVQNEYQPKQGYGYNNEKSE